MVRSLATAMLIFLPLQAKAAEVCPVYMATSPVTATDVEAEALINLRCKVGDIIWVATGGPSWSAFVCSFEKPIVVTEKGVACVYAGLRPLPPRK